MEVIEKTYLKSTSFQLLQNWSVQYLLESKFSYNENFELTPIGKFLTRNKTPLDIQDTKDYKRVTIKVNNGGIFLRDIESGKNIGTKKQFLIKKGQFLLSKIDARNGAFGVVPEEVDGAIITGNFWTFDVDYSKINPYFLALITTTPEFIRFSENASNGTTNRHYLQEDLFLAQKIPLPPLSEQNRIVEAYNKKINQAKELEQKTTETEDNIGKYIDKELGIEFSSEVKSIASTKFLKLISYSKFIKWGVDKQKIEKVRFNKNFETKRIIELCNVSSGGTPSRSRKEYYTGNIPWIKTTEVRNDVIYDTEEKITDDAIKNSSAKLYPKDSLIIAMYGQGATRGRTAKLGIEASTNQACAVLYNIDNSIIDTDYLWIYLMNEYERLRALASGNNQPNLNAQMIKNYEVVIPPVNIQQKIKTIVHEMKVEIKKNKEKSTDVKQQALKDFENEIFKP
jgi:type I restriction enzyme S subunit